MKNMLLLIASLFVFSNYFEADAQKILKKIKRTAKETSEQKAEEKTSETVSESIDKGFEGVKSIFKKKNVKDHDDETLNVDDETMGDNTEPLEAGIMSTEMDEDASTSPFGVYTNFTFVPGNSILFYDDFKDETIGDFPDNWETSGSGEIVSTNVYPGKWLSIHGRSGYFPVVDRLPENYTLEFDMVAKGLVNNRSASSLKLGFINKKSYGLGSAGGHATFQINLSTANMNVANTGPGNTPRIHGSLSKKMKMEEIVHFSMAIDGKRLRIWMDEDKVADVPSLLAADMGRYLLFEIYGINPEKGHTLLLSNFRIAESGNDFNSQMNTSGKFSTTGIYFDTDEARIKPESYAVLKSVADYLKGNPEINIKIVGHTDTKGDEAYNLSLSQKRAEAVSNTLVEEFGIDSKRLKTYGFGEGDPITMDVTEKGHAKNRRVEFIKM